jgi:CheY-like chemotaxis protein
MDIQMPKMNGVQASQNHPGTLILWEGRVLETLENGAAKVVVVKSRT